MSKVAATITVIGAIVLVAASGAEFYLIQQRSVKCVFPPSNVTYAPPVTIAPAVAPPAPPVTAQNATPAPLPPVIVEPVQQRHRAKRHKAAKRSPVAQWMRD